MVLVTHCISLINIVKPRKWIFRDQSGAVMRFFSFRKTWDFEHNICKVSAALVCDTHKVAAFPTLSSRTTSAVFLHVCTISRWVRMRFLC